MTKEHVYHPPKETSELPPALVKFFDGTDLSGRIGEAVRLTTVDEDGWPHAALLSVGEILAVDAKHLRFVISPHSTTTKNITRTGRVSLTLAHDHSLWEIRLKAKRVGDAKEGHNTAIFAADIVSVRVHSVPYAEVVSGVTYRLKEPGPVLERWKLQIKELQLVS